MLASNLDYHLITWTPEVQTTFEPLLQKTHADKGLRAVAFIRMKATTADGSAVVATFAVMEDITSCNQYVKVALSLDDTKSYPDAAGELVTYLLPQASDTFEKHFHQPFPQLIHWEYAPGKYAHLGR